MLEKLDLWLLDNIFQRISDWVWERFPINCFLLAKFFLIISSTCITIGAGSLHMSYGIFLGMIVFVTNYNLIRMIEQTVRPGFMNPYRYSPFNIRVIMSVVVPAIFFILYRHRDIGDLALLTQSGIYYFSGCRTSPPPERKTARFMRHAFG